jgi:hypothetical protein
VQKKQFEKKKQVFALPGKVQKMFKPLIFPLKHFVVFNIYTLFKYVFHNTHTAVAGATTTTITIFRLNKFPAKQIKR